MIRSEPVRYGRSVRRAVDGTMARRGRGRVLRVESTVIACVLAAACASTESSGAPRYSEDEWSEGIDVPVDVEPQAIESATVFQPEGRSWYQASLRTLGESDVAVLQPGEDQYDAIILYRAAPCGIPPGIAVSGDATRLHVEITSIEQADCPAMLAVEAVGMQLASSFAGATVEAAHLTDHFGADEE